MKTRAFFLMPVLALAISLSAGPVLAQTTPQPTPPAATAPAEKMAPTAKKPAMKPAMSADQKAAISKACSAAADKQGLKGKPRKTFRESCKRKGGPTN
ncbi:PsiF family protein [Labrys neptuniae]